MIYEKITVYANRCIIFYIYLHSFQITRIKIYLFFCLWLIIYTFLRSCLIINKLGLWSLTKRKIKVISQDKFSWLNSINFFNEFWKLKSLFPFKCGKYLSLQQILSLFTLKFLNSFETSQSYYSIKQKHKLALCYVFYIFLIFRIPFS